MRQMECEGRESEIKERKSQRETNRYVVRII